MPTIVVVLVIIYFIREQFSFGTVGRLEYIIIPIFALYQFLAVFKATQMDFVLLAIIAIISILISRFQANGSRVRIKKLRLIGLIMIKVNNRFIKNRLLPKAVVDIF